MYAAANLSGNQAYANHYFYESTGRHLALDAIKAHQDAWYAVRKEKELERWYRQEAKIVENLNKKEKKNTELTEAEYDYRKNQGVLLVKIEELINNLKLDVAEYANLVKLDPEELKIEGRRFYELENFDDEYSIEVFQESAVRNRKEFALAKEKMKRLPYSQVRRDISNRYPLVSRLDVNGLKVENEVYEQSLYDKAIKISRNLVKAVIEYKKTPAVDVIRETRLEEAFDELGAAVLTQVEVSYQLVLYADAQYESSIRAEKNLQKKLNQLAKNAGRGNEEKLAFLRAKIDMAELDKKQEQIKAERAVALRDLYFNAGLSPFTITLMKAPLDDISAELREAFNQDLVVMLSGAQAQLKELPVMEDLGAGWAKEPNWLENVVNARGVSAANVKNKSIVKSPLQARGSEILQLGSYIEKANAEADWVSLLRRFPELGNYNRKIEEVSIGGQPWYRLVVVGKQAQLLNLCENMKRAGADCLFR